MGFPSKIEHLDKLKLHHVVIPKKELEAIADENEKSIYNQRCVITINGRVSWQAGTVSLGNESAYITISKAKMKELAVHLGDIVNVELLKDRSEYGMEVPEEFTEVLNQDIEAKDLFDGLTMGIKRAVIYLVLNLKSSEKRIEKSLFFAENLKKASGGKITMRNILGKDLP